MGSRKNIFMAQKKVSSAFDEMGEKARVTGGFYYAGIDFYVVTDFIRIGSGKGEKRGFDGGKKNQRS